MQFEAKLTLDGLMTLIADLLPLLQSSCRYDPRRNSCATK